jgi:hypothetical protein
MNKESAMELHRPISDLSDEELSQLWEGEGRNFAPDRIQCLDNGGNPEGSVERAYVAIKQEMEGRGLLQA